MAIKRNSFRTSEVKRMKDMHAQGFNYEQISNAVSVMVGKVEYVLSGQYDKELKAVAKKQKQMDVDRSTKVEREKQEQAEQLGAAIAAGLQAAGQTQTAEVPAEQTAT